VSSAFQSNAFQSNAFQIGAASGAAAEDVVTRAPTIQQAKGPRQVIAVAVVNLLVTTLAAVVAPPVVPNAQASAPQYRWQVQDTSAGTPLTLRSVVVAEAPFVPTANAANLRADSAAGDVAADRVTRFVAMLSDSLDNLALAVAVPGLLAYAQEQLNDPTFQVVTEYTAARNEMTACRDWIVSNFPADGSGYLLYHQFGVGGRINVRMFSPAALAGLRTQLDALLATLD